MGRHIVIGQDEAPQHPQGAEKDWRWPKLSTPFEQGRKSCYRQYSSGIPGGIDNTEVSHSSRSLATSGGLITFSSMLLNDIDTDSEISFDLNSNHGSSTPIPSPDTSQRSLQPIQNPFSQPATQPSSQQSSQPSTQPSPQPSTQPSPQPSSQLQTPPTMQSSSRTPLRATTGSIRSSIAVTRDARAGTKNLSSCWQSGNELMT